MMLMYCMKEGWQIFVRHGNSGGSGCQKKNKLEVEETEDDCFDIAS